MKVYPTCSLCVNFRSNESYCQQLIRPCQAMDQEQPKECIKKGTYIRNLNVLLDSYHLYDIGETVPMSFKIDISHLPKDAKGIPLFVFTKRGVERAIPAHSGVLMRGDMLVGVHKVYTLQGQRELIFDLGVKYAREIANRKNVELTVFPDEENSFGIEEEIKRYRVYHRRTK